MDDFERRIRNYVLLTWAAIAGGIVVLGLAAWKAVELIMRIAT